MGTPTIVNGRVSRWLCGFDAVSGWLEKDVVAGQAALLARGCEPFLAISLPPYLGLCVSFRRAAGRERGCAGKVTDLVGFRWTRVWP
jgi:hypothetical protein